jgi:hypothetical protein
VNSLRIGAHGDVLRDQREFRAGFSGALVQGRLIEALMQEQILTHHDLGVLSRGLGQRIIPLEGLQSCGRPFAVSRVEKEFLLI